nr:MULTISPECIES: hypothetical protein [Arthrobacter]
MDMRVDASTDSDLVSVYLVHEHLGTAEHFWRVEDRSGSVRQGVKLFPILAVADSNGLFFPHGIGELSDAAVFFGDDEGLVHHSSSS